MRDIQDRAPAPFLGIAVERLHPLLAGDVVAIVGEQQERIAVQQVVHQRAEASGVVGREITRDNHVERLPELGVLAVVTPRVVTLAPQTRDLLDAVPEDEDVVRADGVADFDVGAVERAERERAVQRELHVAGAGGLGAGGRNLLGEIGRRDDIGGGGDVVVRNEHHLEPLAHRGVVVDHVGHGVDQADDELGARVAGRGLAGEQHGARDGIGAGAQAVVARHHVQHVEQLALVLVDALDVHVEQRIGVHGDPEVVADQAREILLVRPLGGAERRTEGVVVGERRDPGERVQVLEPAVAEVVCDERREPRVGLVEPAPGRDAVRDVDDLVRSEAVEVGEDRLPHQARMDCRHAVDAMRTDDGEVCHAHAPVVALVEERHPLYPCLVARMAVAHVGEKAPVDLVDDLEVARQHRLEQTHRPRLQRLRHQGVVGVGKNARDEVPGAVPIEFVHVHEQAHELGDGDRGMGVVELDRDLVRQRVETVVHLPVAVQDVLQRGAHKQVLLLQAQHAAVGGAVVRVEHLGEIFGGILVLDRPDIVARVEGAQVEVARRLGRPQPQIVHGVGAVAGDGRVVGHGHDLLGVHPVVARPAVFVREAHHAPVKVHRVEHLRARELPGVAIAQPVVRLLHLAATLDALAEHAVLVADAVAHARQSEGGHGVEEAGGEPSQPAVAQPGLVLGLAQHLEVDTDLHERLAYRLVDAHVQQTVHERTAHEELKRQVIDTFGIGVVIAPLRFHPALHEPVAHGVGHGVQPVAVGGGVHVLADRIGQAIGDRVLERRGVEAEQVVPRQDGQALRGWVHGPVPWNGYPYVSALRGRPEAAESPRNERGLPVSMMQ